MFIGEFMKWARRLNMKLLRVRKVVTSALQLVVTTDALGIAAILLQPGTHIIIQLKLNCCFVSPWRLGLAGRIFLTWLTHLKEKGPSRDEGTDGAKYITGKHQGFVSRVKSTVPGIESRHCIIHRHALVAKLNLQNILSEVVKIVNFIKSKLMNSRLFTALC